MDHESDVINKVAELAGQKNFFEAILLRDEFDDWNLVSEFGKFLVLQQPDEIMGHALMARACRHLGRLDLAGGELKECRLRAAHPSETELFVQFLADEERKILAERNGN